MIKLLVTMPASGKKCGSCKMGRRTYRPLTNEVMHVKCHLFDEIIENGDRSSRCIRAQLALEQMINKAVQSATAPSDT